MMVNKIWENGIVRLWSSAGVNIVLLYDPVSGWMCGERIELLPAHHEDSSNEDHSDFKTMAEKIACFLIRSCGDFGFIDFELINFKPQLFEAVSAYYRKYHDIFVENVPELQDTRQSFIFSDQLKPTPADLHIQNIIEKSEKFAGETEVGGLSGLELMILKHRFHSTEGSSPFQRLWSRDKDRGDLVGRREIKSSVLICRHCQESFTSKISFRIHQRRHLQGALETGLENGQLVNQDNKKFSSGDYEDEDEDLDDVAYRSMKSANKRRKLKKSRKAEGVEQLKKENEVQDVDHNKLADTVQSLLKVTDPERNRRGEYVCLSATAKDEIAEYALEHGEQAAIKDFSLKNGQELSMSTVRSLVKVYQQYKPEIRKQIGEYARANGLEDAVRHFSTLLGRDVRKSSVRRFRELYSVRRKARGESEAYSLAVKQEIGQYAAEHGVEASVSVYSQKLQMMVKPTTVRTFRRVYGKKAGVGSADTSTTIDLLHSSINVLNQGGEGYYTIQYSTAPQTSQAAQLQYYSLPSTQSVDYSIAVHGGQPTESQTQQLEVQPKIVKGAEESQDLSGKNHKPGEPRETTSAKETEDTQENVVAKKYERGRYVQYSAEMRANIGKFAAQHGNVAAVRHFSKELGRTISESTIRTMRDKYLALRKKGVSVTEVGSKVRGRPSVLGTLDKVLMNTLVRLEEKGEKITQFAVIATAKQLLTETGCESRELNLTQNWARSILRRLAQRNKTT